MSSMERLQMRLREYFPSHAEKSINLRTDRINDFISKFQKLSYSFEDFKKRPGMDEKLIQDQLVAYLFFRDEQSAPEKLQVRIKAVVSLLEGNHIHVGTGGGKSRWIFPIASLVDAITSPKRSSALCSTDESTLTSLNERLKYFNEILKPITGEISFLDRTKKEKTEQLFTEKLKKEMMAEALSEDSYSPALRKKIQKKYWHRLESLEKKEELKNKTEAKTTINLFTDRSLIFEYEEKGQDFLDNLPNVFFDEADIAYNRRSPYVQINRDRYYTAEELYDSTSTWLIRYVLTQQLNFDKDFSTDKDGFNLVNKKRKELHENFLNQINSLNRENPIGRSAYQGLEMIYQYLEVADEKIKNKISAKLINRLREFVKDPSQIEVLIEDSVLMKQLREEKNLTYAIKEKKPFVRDPDVDQFLEDHRFSWNEEMNILAMEGIFDFVPMESVINKSLYFQTFAKLLGKRLRCGSGTLRFPDGEKQTIKDTSFSRFLKDITGHEVITLIPPEFKNLPDPEIYKKEDETIKALISGIQDSGHNLIISYDLVKSQAIYDKLSKKYGKDQVIYIPSKPSDSAKLKKYQKEVDKAYKDLADGRIKIIVSSGASGYAVNIVNSDGSPPDLRILIHNLPQNRSQLYQILGRRRAQGPNFGWYISEEFLDKYIALFEKKISKLSILLGEKSQSTIRNKLISAPPSEKKKLVLQLLAKYESLAVTDDQYHILFDELTDRLSAHLSKDLSDKVRAFPYLANIITNDLIGLPDSLKSLLANRFLETNLDKNPHDLKEAFKNLELHAHKLLPEIAENWFKIQAPVLSRFYETVTEGGLACRIKEIKENNFFPIKDNENYGLLRMGLFYQEKFRILNLLGVKKDDRHFLLYPPDFSQEDPILFDDKSPIIARLLKMKPEHFCPGNNIVFLKNQ